MKRWFKNRYFSLNKIGCIGHWWHSKHSSKKTNHGPKALYSDERSCAQRPLYRHQRNWASLGRDGWWQMCPNPQNTTSFQEEYLGSSYQHNPVEQYCSHGYCTSDLISRPLPCSLVWGQGSCVDNEYHYLRSDPITCSWHEALQSL